MKFNLTKANQELLVKVVIGIIIVGIVYIPTNNKFNSKINDLISDKTNLFLVICLVGLVGYLDIKVGIMLVLFVLVLIVKNKNFEGFQNEEKNNAQNRISSIITDVKMNKDKKEIVSELLELSGSLIQESNNNKQSEEEESTTTMPPNPQTTLMPPTTPSTTIQPSSETSAMPPDNLNVEMPPTTPSTTIQPSSETSAMPPDNLNVAMPTSSTPSGPTNTTSTTSTTSVASNDSFQNTIEQEQEDRVVAYCRGFTQELCPPECSPLDCQPDPNEDDVIENFPRSSVPVNPKRKITEGFTSSCANVSGNLQTQTVLSDRVDLDIQGCRLDNRRSDLNYTNFGPPLASCESFNKETFDNVGTYFYPLN